VTIAERPLEVSLIVGAHFFSSTAALGRSDYAAPGSDLRHSAAIGARIGYGLSRHFLLEGEFVAMPTQLAEKPAQVLVYTGRGHLMFRWPFGGNDRFQPFILAGGGAIGVRPDPGLPLRSEVLGAFHAGAGMRFDLNRWVGLRVDGRIVLVPEIRTPSFTPDYEALASVYGRFGFGSDKPAEPPKPIDIDQDGIPDKEDRCPSEKGPTENSGCPDRDGDGDSIVDRLDKCPQQAGPAENGGCPDVDTDSDGVVDRLDKCPTEIGPQVNQGCPDIDSDSDGIVDRLDKCPQQPETVNNYQDQDGCPDELPSSLARFVDKKIEGVQFLPNKADLLPSSFTVLDQAVAAVAEVPTVRLEVQGHTDNVGNPNDNLTLSQARADAVKAYLISKGVDATRLQAVGYGSTRPVADNNQATGRAQNRRVEFKLIPPARPTVIRKAPAAPANQTAAPANQTAAPANQTAAPANQTAAPANQTAAPANQTAAPASPAKEPAIVPVAPPPVVQQPAPAAPSAPAVPSAPAAPSAPTAPSAPAVPSAPAAPAAPSAPAVPSAPSTPSVLVPPPPA
jgi:OOP family OmpA-OmpF porin